MPGVCGRGCAKRREEEEEEEDGGREMCVYVKEDYGVSNGVFGGVRMRSACACSSVGVFYAFLSV